MSATMTTSTKRPLSFDDLPPAKKARFLAKANNDAVKASALFAAKVSRRAEKEQRQAASNARFASQNAELVSRGFGKTAANMRLLERFDGDLIKVEQIIHMRLGRKEARVNERLGDLSAKLPELESKVKELTPASESPFSTMQLARVLTKTGDVDKALDAIRKRLERKAAGSDYRRHFCRRVSRDAKESATMSPSEALASIVPSINSDGLKDRQKQREERALDRAQRKLRRETDNSSHVDASSSSSSSGTDGDSKEKKRGKRHVKDTKDKEKFNYPVLSLSSSLVESKTWPAQVPELFLDGNNMLFVKDHIRALVLKGSRVKAEAALCQIVVDAIASLSAPPQKCVLIFDDAARATIRSFHISVPLSTTSVTTVPMEVCVARPTRPTSDEVLIDWAREKQLKAQADAAATPAKLSDAKTSSMTMIPVSSNYAVPTSTRHTDTNSTCSSSSSSLKSVYSEAPAPSSFPAGVVRLGMVVVTSDRGLSNHLHNAGATVVKPKDFLHFAEAVTGGVKPAATSASQLAADGVLVETPSLAATDPEKATVVSGLIVVPTSSTASVAANNSKLTDHSDLDFDESDSDNDDEDDDDE